MSTKITLEWRGQVIIGTLTQDPPDYIPPRLSYFSIESIDGKAYGFGMDQVSWCDDTWEDFLTETGIADAPCTSEGPF